MDVGNVTSINYVHDRATMIAWRIGDLDQRLQYNADHRVLFDRLDADLDRYRDIFWHLTRVIKILFNKNVNVFFPYFGTKNIPMQYIGLNQSNRVFSTLRSRYFINVRTKSTALKLAHRIYGPSPTPSSVPIIVLHDCLETKNNWEMICKKLLIAYKTPVIAVDARNHGDSPYYDCHDYTSLAADVTKLYSHFAIEKGIIIGHSMGGRTGMVLALNEPCSVAGLVVVDISPVSTSRFLTDYFPKVIDVLKTVDFKGLDLNKAKEAAKNKILEHHLYQSDKEIQALLLNIGRLPDESIGWKFNLDILKEQFENIAAFPDIPSKTYSGPTLFVAGKLSHCVPTEDLAGIHKVFPSARLIYIDGVGHNVHVEDPDGFVSAVINTFDYDAVLKTPS